jgi:hypothetical protein
MNQPNVFPQQLSSQVGAGINQQIPFWQAENHTTSSAFIFRVGAPTNVATAPDGWHADRRACTKQDHFTADIGTDWESGQRHQKLLRSRFAAWQDMPTQQRKQALHGPVSNSLA